MKRRREEFPLEIENGLSKIIDLPIEVMSILLKELDTRSVSSLCRALLVDLVNMVGYKCVTIVTCLVDRWKTIGGLTLIGVSPRSAAYIFGAFAATTWCDCCEIGVAIEQVSSTDYKNKWHFCENCVKIMTPDMTGDYNFNLLKEVIQYDWKWKWISYFDMLDFLGLGRREGLDDKIRDNISSREFVHKETNYKGTVSRTRQTFYLFKDVLPHIPK